MGAQEQVDLSKYGTVNNGPVDLSKYGTVQGGDERASIGGVASTMADQAGRAIGAAGEYIVPTIKTLGRLLYPPTTGEEARSLGTNAFNATTDAVGRTRQALANRKYGEAAKSAIGAVPLFGPPAEQITRDVTSGQFPEAIGHAGALYLMGKAPQIARASGPMLLNAAKSAPGAIMDMLGSPWATGVRAAIPEIPMMPKKLGDLVEPFKKFRDAKYDAANAEAVAEIPYLIRPEPFEPFKPSPSVARKIQYGGPAPSQANAPAYAARGKGWTPPQGPLVPTGSEELPAPPKFETNPTVAKRMKFTPSPAPGGGPSYLPTPKGYTVPESSLTPEAPEPEIPNPEPFKPNPTVAKRMRFTPGQESSRPSYGGQQSTPAYVRRRMAEEAEAAQKQRQAQGDINSGLPVRVTPPPNAMDLESIAKGKFLDTTTPEGRAFKKLSLKDQSAVTEQALKYSTPEPVTSTVSPFKGHSAEMTDLIRQWHSQWPKGTSMKDVASQVYGLPKGTMPSYEQALKVHEYMLRNQGKIPTAQDLGLPKPPG